MRKGIGVIVVLCIMSAGCIDIPPNPLSSAPGLIMDYDKDTSTTKIWVRGEATDYKYSKITILIDGTDKMEDNNTYCLSHSTYLSVFSLEIVVQSENTCYKYSCDVIVKDSPRFTITDTKHPNGITVSEKDLPFTRVIEEVKE